MNKSEKIIAQFENLGCIEASEDWNQTLMQKLEHSKRPKGNGFANSLVMMLILILVSVNILVFSRTRTSSSAQEKNFSMQNIASEFLITTTSSKY